MNFKSFTAQLAGAASIISNGNLPRGDLHHAKSLQPGRHSGTRVDASRKHASQVDRRSEPHFTTYCKDTSPLVPLWTLQERSIKFHM